MHLFLALFGRWLQFHYQCFDRVVINGYLRVFFHEGSVVNFFREVCGVARITKEVLRARTDDYNRWVAAYCANHGVPLVWATKGERKEEIVCNNLGDFGIRKQLCHLGEVRERFASMLDRFAHAKAEHLNVHGHLDLIADIAPPVVRGRAKVAGIKLENTRIMRLLEVLLRKAGGSFGAWRTEQLRTAIREEFGLKPQQYSLNQIRYDLRKLAAHGIIQRFEHTYAYHLTDTGQKIAVLLTLFARRIYGPVCSSVLDHRPERKNTPQSLFEQAYCKVDQSMDELLTALAA